MNAPFPALFPMFLKLAGRSCVVVGGGTIAESKVESLLASDAVVIVVSPTLTAKLQHQDSNGSLSWIPRRFDPTDLDGAFLVIAATSDDGVNELVFREAERRGILCNAVDQPPRCHFYFPAVVRRGALQIAISTGGLSPSLARRLREEFEADFGPEYGEWLLWLGTVREALMQRKLDFATRKRLLAYLARRESFDRWRTARQPKPQLQEVA
jgi:precorrin-2 dehydrogenase/sirohydrochlorin ferrochelatase